MAQVQDIKDIKKRPDPRIIILTPKEELETEIRSCVKRVGGFKLGLSEERQQYALDKLAQFNELTGGNRTSDDRWDESVICPGHKNILAGAPRIKPGVMQDQAIITLQKDVKALSEENATLLETVKEQSRQMAALLVSQAPPQDVDLDAMTVSELRTLAETKGVELGTAFVKKQDLIELIQASE